VLSDNKCFYLSLFNVLLGIDLKYLRVYGWLALDVSQRTNLKGGYQTWLKREKETVF
jgi:hypothetical protein